MEVGVSFTYSSHPTHQMSHQTDPGPDYLFSQFLSQILSVSHFSIFSVHNFEVLNFYQKFLNPLAQGDFRRDHIIYIVRIKLEQ